MALKLRVDPLTGVPSWVQPGFSTGSGIGSIPKGTTLPPIHNDQDRAPGVWVRDSLGRVVSVATGEIGTEDDLAGETGTKTPLIVDDNNNGIPDDEEFEGDTLGGIDETEIVGGSPEAVYTSGAGWLAVYYDKLGIEMKEVH